MRPAGPNPTSPEVTVVGRDVYVKHQTTIGASYREVIGRHFPAMSVVVVQGLIESQAQVEI
jgi:hypothetical protein